MAIQTLETLKGYFSSGKYQTQSNYEDLIDTLAASGGSISGLKQVDLNSYTDGTEGDLVQHIGESTGGYTYGYIYKLVSNQWTQIDVQPSSSLTAGTNISINNGVISATDTTYTANDFDIKDLSDSTDLRLTWSSKQDALTAGDNITIDNNVISATGGNGLKQVDLTTYSDGVEGEIVQHIGVTTNEYTNGYIYKYQQGQVIRYEDIVVPSGSTCLVYTNKFDQSIKKVYSVETIELDYQFYVKYDSSIKLYSYDSNFESYMETTSTQWIDLDTQSTNVLGANGTYIGPGNTSLCVFNTYGTSINVPPNNIESAYNHLMNRGFSGGFRTSVNDPSISLQLLDLIARVIIPRVNTDTGEVITDSVAHMRLSKLRDCNWNLRTYLSTYNPENYPFLGRYDYDESRSDSVRYQLSHLLYVDPLTGNNYIAETGTSGAGAGDLNELYRTVTESGEELFIPLIYKNCVLKIKPIPAATSVINFNDDLVPELYLDYTCELTTTSEDITIHRRVPEYDEYGLPVMNQMGLIWNRINVQPSGSDVKIYMIDAVPSGEQSDDESILVPCTILTPQETLKSLYDDVKADKNVIVNVVLDGVIMGVADVFTANDDFIEVMCTPLTTVLYNEILIYQGMFIISSDGTIVESNTPVKPGIHIESTSLDISQLPDLSNLRDTWNNKQEQLTAGDGITIDSSNVISANLWTSITD